MLRRGDLWLIEPPDLDGPASELPIRLEVVLKLRETVRWAKTYLCRPHPNLGRTGPVCPFVQPSLNRRCLWLTAREGDLQDGDVDNVLCDYREWFLELEPRDTEDRTLKAIVVLFPDLPLERGASLVDSTQARLKPTFTELGLMIGQFHPFCEEPGVRNPEFRPLISPMPMLVIRFMVPEDVPFLKTKPRFLSSYIHRFDAVPVRFHEMVTSKLREFGLWHLSSPYRGVLELGTPVYPPPPHDVTRKTTMNRRVRHVLQHRGVPYRVHRHADVGIPIRSPSEFASALGLPIERITKSVFVRSQAGDLFAMLVCSAALRIDFAPVAAFLRIGRVELASKSELEQRVGYPPNGVSPIGLDSIPVVLDEKLLSLESVLIGAGEVGVEIEISPSHLKEVTGGGVLSFTS